MKYALLLDENSSKLEFVSRLPFGVSPPMIWVECGDDVSVDTHEFVDGKFVLKQSTQTDQ